MSEQSKPEDIATDGKAAFIDTCRSESMRGVLDMARRVAKFDSSVLITGETGTGKEVLARYIHELSPRSRHSMLAINCGALPETLLESELFGHKAGSFTGAIRDRVGLFEQAARGTILLDEIGDISPLIQIKLIRVLQEREILRIGENIPRKVDTRILAATNRSLDEEIKAGHFRQDLLYRLRVIEIVVPPLRRRRDDIPPLTHLLTKNLERKLKLPGITLDAACLDIFLRYDWPGNVRELQNAIERAAILSGIGKIQPRHLPARMLATKPSAESDAHPIPASDLQSLAEMEIAYIQQVLRTTGGNKGETARILGIGQATLWRKLKSLHDL